MATPLSHLKIPQKIFFLCYYIYSELLMLCLTFSPHSSSPVRGTLFYSFLCPALSRTHRAGTGYTSIPLEHALPWE